VAAGFSDFGFAVAVRAGVLAAGSARGRAVPLDRVVARPGEAVVAGAARGCAVRRPSRSTV